MSQSRPPHGQAGPEWRERFPGFDAAAQSHRWDAVTAGVVLSRLGRPPDISFLTPAEEAVATALVDQLLDQADTPDERRVPVVALIDARLAARQSDGWRYQDMPDDGQAWKNTMCYLDEDAEAQCGRGFATCPDDVQKKLIQAVQDSQGERWHGLPASHVWSLWTRYACTAYYAHPWAWDEIGFPGPAYPRGYKNAGVDRREPFEVEDRHSEIDPARRGD